MIKLSWMSGAALAACVLLAGCFTSEQPLFDQALGSPLMGAGDVEITTHDTDKEEAGTLHWQSGVYVDLTDKDHASISFHRLPGTWPWDGWYVGETQMSDAPGKGYLYELYRKQGGRLYNYNVSCSDLTDLEAAQTHMARSESNQECTATRQADLAAALRLLAKRESPDGYWTWKPAPPAPAGP
ncbi:MAG TPA: hypothetical protein VG983_07740 [Caulobacterales bacterium]|jgi:hypothetical protein|nr:hypothetical protein [Caulobacterales bacterium]